jgi:uncharacterized repeat protein (TIGR03803 family)
MKKSALFFLLAANFLAMFTATLIFARSASGAGPSETVLHRFKGTGRGANDAGFPYASLVTDQKGNLYGTSFVGGSGTCDQGGTNIGCGTVFEVSPPTTKGGSWTEHVLYSFLNGNDGSFPHGSLVFDPQGNLYGTTYGGGSSFCGVIFQLAPPPKQGDPWTQTVLYTFTGGADGAASYSGLVRDRGGNLYGTTSGNGQFSGGTAFQLSPPVTKGGPWTETTLYAFGSKSDDATGPVGNLVFGKGGRLYGTSATSASGGSGTVFRLIPPKTKGGAWSDEVLYRFQGGNDGKGPGWGVIFDASGNLYGTTLDGGDISACGGVGCGSAFRLAPPSGKGSWTETKLYSFKGSSDGQGPLGRLIFDSKGNLYGTTFEFGSGKGGGTVFELTPPAKQGDPWTETTLHAFAGGKDGSSPRAGLIFGKGGALYGTTSQTNANSTWGNGTAFKIVP